MFKTISRPQCSETGFYSNKGRGTTESCPCICTVAAVDVVVVVVLVVVVCFLFPFLYQIRVDFWTKGWCILRIFIWFWVKPSNLQTKSSSMSPSCRCPKLVSRFSTESVMILCELPLKSKLFFDTQELGKRCLFKGILMYFFIYPGSQIEFKDY